MAAATFGGNIRNSLKNSLFAGNLAGDGCDHHCVASQSFARPRIVVNLCAKTPYFKGISYFWVSLQTPKNGNLDEISEKSPGQPAKIPVSRRLSVEINFDRHCAVGAAGGFALLTAMPLRPLADLTRTRLSSSRVVPLVAQELHAHGAIKVSCYRGR